MVKSSFLPVRAKDYLQRETHGLLYTNTSSNLAVPEPPSFSK